MIRHELENAPSPSEEQYGMPAERYGIWTRFHGYLQKTQLFNYTGSVLNILSSIGLIIGAAIFFIEIPDRTDQKDYAAWLLLNSFRDSSQSVNAKRRALRNLLEDDASISGADLTGANLSGLDLSSGEFARTVFDRSDLSKTCFNSRHGYIEIFGLRLGGLFGINKMLMPIVTTNLSHAHLMEQYSMKRCLLA